jgi:tetratricopeptide (TPR) repeat protein
MLLSKYLRATLFCTHLLKALLLLCNVLHVNREGIYTGNALVELGNLDKAWLAFERALALDSKQHEAWNDKAKVSTLNKHYSAALRYSDQALSLEPGSPENWDTRGAILLVMQRYDEALSALDHALRLDETFASAWQHKSQVLRSLGRVAAAEQADQQALNARVDPSSGPQQ